MAKKNTIRLTESELKKIISESVKKVLKESGDMDRSALYQRVKNVYNNGEGSFYDLMDEFGMSEDELYKTGIADMWGNLDAIKGYERQEKMFAHQYENKESKLKKIVSESVRKVLRESIYDVNDGFTSSMTNNTQGDNAPQVTKEESWESVCERIIRKGGEPSDVIEALGIDEETFYTNGGYGTFAMVYAEVHDIDPREAYEMYGEW
jgi:hypothetical protein